MPCNGIFVIFAIVYQKMLTMKHFRLVSALFLFLSAMSFTSCDEDGDLIVPPVRHVSGAEFARLVDGKSWKYVESHELNGDGTMRKDGYFEDLIGIGPEQYSFSGDSVTTYMYLDAYPLKCHKVEKYTFQEGTNVIKAGQDDVFTVVSVSEDRLCILADKGSAADGKRMYVYSVYRAMAAGERPSLKELYPVNLNTIDEDYPLLPEQEDLTEADFTALAVGRTWRCAEVHGLFVTGRYDKADFFATDTWMNPIDYEITADSVYEVTRLGGRPEPVRTGYAYTFNANGRYVETQGGTTFSILRLAGDEMHLIQQRYNTAGGSYARLYCVYRQAGLDE